MNIKDCGATMDKVWDRFMSPTTTTTETRIISFAIFSTEELALIARLGVPQALNNYII